MSTPAHHLRELYTGFGLITMKKWGPQPSCGAAPKFIASSRGETTEMAIPRSGRD